MIPLNLSSNYESGSLSYFNLSSFFSLQRIAAKHRESEHTRSRTSLRILKKCVDDCKIKTFNRVINWM